MTAVDLVVGNAIPGIGVLDQVLEDLAYVSGPCRRNRRRGIGLHEHWLQESWLQGACLPRAYPDELLVKSARSGAC